MLSNIRGHPCHSLLAAGARRKYEAVSLPAKLYGMRPCMTCGRPTNNGSRCDECAPSKQRWQERGRRRDSTAARGYGSSWQALSARARKLQPFCLECGSTQDLQTDHLPIAHWRQARGLPVRLSDVRVLCGPCNVRAGDARPGSKRYEKWLKSARARPWGVDPRRAGDDPDAKHNSRLN